jgi:hypothetical protein
MWELVALLGTAGASAVGAAWAIGKTGKDVRTESYLTDPRTELKLIMQWGEDYVGYNERGELTVDIERWGRDHSQGSSGRPGSPDASVPPYDGPRGQVPPPPPPVKDWGDYWREQDNRKDRGFGPDAKEPPA